MLILKLRRSRVRKDGVRSVVPLVRTKTRKYGPVLDEKALSVKTDWLVSGANSSGKTRWITRVHTEAPDSGFLPFFRNWPALYREGLVDGAEWRARRFEWFLAASFINNRIQEMTNTNSMLQRGAGKRKTWIGVIVFALLIGSAQHALTRPAHAQTALQVRDKGEKPSQAEIDIALTDLLLCEWMTAKGSSLGSDRLIEVLEHLAENNPAKGSGELVGEFHVLGHVFQRLLTAIGQGGGGALGWSTTSTTDAIVRTLQERGYTFEPITRPMVGFAGKMTRGSTEYAMWVGNGYHPFGPQRSTEGVTMMCGARRKE